MFEHNYLIINYYLSLINSIILKILIKDFF
jgi:hypothetical protein